VLVDEYQDVNQMQVDIVTSLRPNGDGLTVVGDEAQAIYGFRGADEHAVDRVVEALSASTMPLSVSYRCARSIVMEAQKIVPDLEAAPGAEDGTVSESTYRECLREAAPGDFILSRTNKPLVEMTLRLLSEGRPATMLGRDFSGQLMGLVRKSKAISVRELLAWVDDWADKQATRLLRKGKDPNAPRDKAECLSMIAEGQPSVDAVIDKIRALFPEEVDDADRIVLSSTHKAKGLERDRVWLLRDTYMKSSGWTDPVEEENLYYVAVTRAKRDLRLVA